MNFTREPIIETIITPREGCKLVVRNSKNQGGEDYFVDAVEVVSFGHSFFFRSQERPKSFLVPVSDYEVLELKETRMILKNASPERSIKIGGGKEAPQQRSPQRELSGEEPGQSSSSEPRSDRKREKRRRGRRGRDRVDASLPSGAAQLQGSEEPASLPQDSFDESSLQPKGEEEVKAPSFISKLFPPPTTLIKDTLSRYKPIESSEATPPSFEEASSFPDEDRLPLSPYQDEIEDPEEE